MPNDLPHSIDPEEIPLGYEPILGPQDEQDAQQLYFSLLAKHGRFMVIVRDGEAFWVWVRYHYFWIS